MAGPDHRYMAGDALLGGSKGKEVSQALVLEVSLVEGLEWGVDIKIVVEENGEAGVIEASSHVTKFLWKEGVYAEAMCVQGDIHQHDGVSGSGSRENGGRRRNSIS